MNSFTMTTNHPANSYIERPSLIRRLRQQLTPMALIILLHIGLFVILRDSLLHSTRALEPMEVVTAILFPPSPKPTPTQQIATPPTPPKPVQHRPLTRPIAKPQPVAKPAAFTPPTASVTPTPVAAPVSEPAATVEAAPPAPAVAAEPPSPKTITSGVQYLQPPQPEYPTQSKRLGEEGKVVLRVLINTSGHADKIELQQSSGHSRLDDAAREAVQQAIFKPHIENGQAVPVFALVPINFRLE